MDYERCLLKDALNFEFDGRGYRFESEFTQEELREMEARATEAPEAPAEAVPRITGNWWCACGKCRQMPQTEVEKYKMDPKFRKKDGCICLFDSEDAKKVKAEKRPWTKLFHQMT
ncbi:unnamed protein product [Boreogadus saida]